MVQIARKAGFNTMYFKQKMTKANAFLTKQRNFFSSLFSFDIRRPFETFEIILWLQKNEKKKKIRQDSPTSMNELRLEELDYILLFRIQIFG